MAKRDRTVGREILACGTIGRIRAKSARDYPGSMRPGLCDINEELGQNLAADRPPRAAHARATHRAPGHRTLSAQAGGA